MLVVDKTNDNLEMEVSEATLIIEIVMIRNNFNYGIDYENQDVGDLGSKS